jgi:hypothetical protein
MVLQVSSSVTSITDFHLEKDGLNSPKIFDSLKSMTALQRLQPFVFSGSSAALCLERL